MCRRSEQTDGLLGNRTIHQKVCHVLEKAFERELGARVDLRSRERPAHQFEPSLGSRRRDCKRHMSSPQSGMAALVDVSVRATEAIDKEITQPLFGSFHVVGRIHRTKDVVARHLLVEGATNAAKPLLANAAVD